IVVRSVDSHAAEILATSLADSIRQELTTLSLPAGLEASSAPRVLGPAPAPIARLRERWRWHFQVHGPDGEQLRAALARVFLRTTVPDNVAWMVDVDPVEML
ncbi:MAG: primosomal protein N', partial [Planctomycetaceae bacterium]